MTGLTLFQEKPCRRAGDPELWRTAGPCHLICGWIWLWLLATLPGDVRFGHRFRLLRPLQQSSIFEVDLADKSRRLHYYDLESNKKARFESWPYSLEQMELESMQSAH
jgi:hypothetical protein